LQKGSTTIKSGGGVDRVKIGTIAAGNPASRRRQPPSRSIRDICRHVLAKTRLATPEFIENS
jgi:hypothetical protein